MVPMGFLDALFYGVPSLVYPSHDDFPSASFAFFFVTSSCVHSLVRWQVHCNVTPTSTRTHKNMKHVAGVFAEGVAAGPSDPTSVRRADCGEATVPFPRFAETILLYGLYLFGWCKTRTMPIGGNGLRSTGGGEARHLSGDGFPEEEKEDEENSMADDKNKSARHAGQ
ncbi:hypothetical protein TcYC6_0102890 [Trypanosoma cruzi]|nr:hypothetical protein TcYC6_0103370 [Trypanosoma cruzi]KAF8294441.1 hypothetical protein TcYC6_0102890 [Trypanosoma cruzi]